MRFIIAESGLYLSHLRVQGKLGDDSLLSHQVNGGLKRDETGRLILSRFLSRAWIELCARKNMSVAGSSITCM